PPEVKGRRVQRPNSCPAVTGRGLDISYAGAYMISPLKKRPWLITVLLALAVSSAAQAQSQPGLGAAEPMAVDARISAALRQVSAGRVRANIEKLASFGTRA